MENNNFSNLRKQVVASCLSGFFSRVLFHPVDTCKSRIQASLAHREYTTTIGACIGTINESGVKGLYRGLGIALTGGIPGICIYLTGYEISKDLLIRKYNVQPFAAYLTSGILVEALCCSIFVPVDVIKERLQVYQHIDSGNTYYRNSSDALQKILKNEGIRGLYKGYFATVLSFGPFSSLYFLFYEKFKALYKDIFGVHDVNFEINLMTSACAGGLASFLTNPLDLLKLKVQIKESKSSPLKQYVELTQHIVKINGIPGLFSGASARVLYHAPSTAVSMALFEYFKTNLPHQM